MFTNGRLECGSAIKATGKSGWASTFEVNIPYFLFLIFYFPQ